MISIITLKTSVYLLKWVLNAIGCLSHGQNFPHGDEETPNEAGLFFMIKCLTNV